MISRKIQLQKSGALFFTAFIWGVAFVAQSEAIKYTGAFTINCIRFLLGALTLLPVIFIMSRKRKTAEAASRETKTPWLGGIVCGIILCAATNVQQIGIKYTTAGKAGFITAFYIVLVPVFGIFLKKRVSLIVWLSVLIAFAGLSFLCINKEDLSVGKGELLVFACSVLFTLQILCVDFFGKNADSVKLACIEFLTSGILSGVFMLGFERPDINGILSAWLPILYAGVFSCGVGYTLQIVGQKNFNPTVAALIMSFESVFSVLAGWLILNQRLSSAEALGCLLMFIAIILSQLPAPSDMWRENGIRKYFRKK